MIYRIALRASEAGYSASVVGDVARYDKLLWPRLHESRRPHREGQRLLSGSPASRGRVPPIHLSYGTMPLH